MFLNSKLTFLNINFIYGELIKFRKKGFTNKTPRFLGFSPTVTNSDPQFDWKLGACHMPMLLDDVNSLCRGIVDARAIDNETKWW